MSVIQAIIIGIIQGLTEFLPVSSSGHIVIAQYLFNVKESGVAFEVFVHFGSLFAVFYVFHKDILGLTAGLFSLPSRLMGSKGGEKSNIFQHLLLMLICSTITTAVIVIPFKGFFKSFYSRPVLIGLMLIVTGIILMVASKLKIGSKNIDRIRVFDSILVGACQGIAVIPGISRSGATVAGSLLRGMGKDTAFRFSFLLSIPAILGAVILEMRNVISAGINPELIIPYIAGALSAALSGIFALKLFRKMLEKDKLIFFSVYCILAGIISSLYFLLLYNGHDQYLGLIFI